MHDKVMTTWTDRSGRILKPKPPKEKSLHAAAKKKGKLGS